MGIGRADIYSLLPILLFCLSSFGQTKPDTTKKSLTDTTFQLEEVTVSTGYQTIPKERATGSFAIVDSALFNRSFSTDVLSRLEGVVSGLRFNRQDLNSNSVDLTLRGPITIRANDQPLIILDNFEYNGDLKNINPNDVLQVTILKDAAAASIWGAKAGNGVIVITTKSGKYNQQTQVSLSSNISMQGKEAIFKSPWLPSSDYIDLETYLFKQGQYDESLNSVYKTAVSPVVWLLNERKNGHITAADSAAAIDSYRHLDVRNDLNKYYLRNSLLQQHAASLTGGGDNHQYYASVGWDKNMGRTIGAAYDRFTISLNNTVSFFNNRLEVKGGVLYTKTNDDRNDPYPVYSYPYAQLADANGNNLPIARYNQNFLDTVGQGRLLDWSYRPLDELEYADNTVGTTDMKVNVNAGYRLSDWLKINVVYQYANGQTNTRDHYSQDTYYTRDLINQFSSISTNGEVSRPIPLGGILDLSTSLYKAHHIRGQLDIQKNWSDHEINGLIGGELSNLNNQDNGSRFYGYREDRPGSSAVDAVNLFTSSVTGYNNLLISNSQGLGYLTDRFLSVYANGSYAYRHTYVVTGSMRKDGSNLFGVRTNQKWSPLWSAGVRWNMNKEAFYNLHWLPELNLRLTYGTSGNIDKTVTAYLVAKAGSNNGYGQRVLNINNPPNPDLSWETVRTLNAAVDFTLLSSKRMKGSIEYYNKHSNNLMADAELSAVGGLLTYRGNTAAMKGRGIDLTLSIRNLDGVLKWQTTLLYSFSRNEVTEYRITPANNSAYLGAYKVGKPIDARFGYRWAGLNPVNGNPQGYVNGEVTDNYGSIFNSTNLNDLVYIGTSSPNHFGSLRNNLDWKDLSLSINLTFKFDYYFSRDLLNYTNLFNGSFAAGSADFLKRWQKPGDEQWTDVPSMIYPASSSRDNFYKNSEMVNEKGDHIRIQDVRLGYSFNKAAKRWLPFKNLQVFLIANNVGLLWKATKLDYDADYGYEYGQIAFSGGVKIDL